MPQLEPLYYINTIKSTIIILSGLLLYYGYKIQPGRIEKKEIMKRMLGK